MADQEKIKELKDYVVPALIGVTSCIIPLKIKANNFEQKSGLMQMVQHSCQFGGLPYDDANDHIASLLEIYETQRINGVSAEVIKLNLFPFSLKNK